MDTGSEFALKFSEMVLVTFAFVGMVALVSIMLGFMAGIWPRRRENNYIDDSYRRLRIVERERLLLEQERKALEIDRLVRAHLAQQPHMLDANTRSGRRYLGMEDDHDA